MRRSDLEWDYLSRHLLLPSVCLAVAFSVLLASHWLHGVESTRYRELTANYVAVHADYDELVTQRRVVDRYHRRYQGFRELGFIAHESRLDWVESLQTVAARVGIPHVKYTIEPQAKVVPPVNSTLSSEEIAVRVSRLKLEMGLVHELDLLRFFDALQERAPGLIKVDDCKVEVSGAADFRSHDPNLTTSCAVQIYSVETSDVVNEVTG